MASRRARAFSPGASSRLATARAPPRLSPAAEPSWATSAKEKQIPLFFSMKKSWHVHVFCGVKELEGKFRMQASREDIRSRVGPCLAHYGLLPSDVSPDDLEKHAALFVPLLT